MFRRTIGTLFALNGLVYLTSCVPSAGNLRPSKDLEGDLNGDGYTTLEEIYESQGLNNGDEIDQIIMKPFIKCMFGIWDRDGNEKLDSTEFPPQDMFKKRNVMRGVECAYDALDTNGDENLTEEDIEGLYGMPGTIKGLDGLEIKGEEL